MMQPATAEEVDRSYFSRMSLRHRQLTPEPLPRRSPVQSPEIFEAFDCQRFGLFGSRLPKSADKLPQFSSTLVVLIDALVDQGVGAPRPGTGNLYDTLFSHFLLPRRS